jgi:hypothetical protein
LAPLALARTGHRQGHERFHTLFTPELAVFLTPLAGRLPLRPLLARIYEVFPLRCTQCRTERVAQGRWLTWRVEGRASAFVEAPSADPAEFLTPQHRQLLQLRRG